MVVTTQLMQGEEGRGEGGGQSRGGSSSCTFFLFCITMIQPVALLIDMIFVIDTRGAMGHETSCMILEVYDQVRSFQPDFAKLQ